MSQLPLIRLLTTGGTIATTYDDERDISRPSVSPDELKTLVGHDLQIEASELLRTASWSLSPEQMSDIALAAREATQRPDVTGVVVTHGTSTLEYTAFLTYLVVDSQVPVVFTGAMRHADDPHADGPANLRDAVIAAAAPETRGWGAIVCFAGQLLAARSAWKRHRSAINAFEDTEGPLADVEDGKILLRRRPPARRRPLTGRMVPGVALVKAFPGASGIAVEALVASGAPGLVIEALPGSGGVPPDMQPAIREASRRIPVVVASRAPVGRVPDPPTGGTGETLRDAPLISAGDLTAEKAWVLLSLALWDTRDVSAVRRIFQDVTRSPAQEDDRHEGR